MAAETLAQSEVQVAVFDAMPSVGRKFLMAGKGGLNITHAEPLIAFLGRYGATRPAIEPMLRAFDPTALRQWIHDLGIDTFVGSSGRVFPTEMKAAPLLRAWQRRLRQSGVEFHVRHRWLGWQADGQLRFSSPGGDVTLQADAVVLALGGASWPKFGSTGAWVPLLAARGVDISPLQPANCGFDVTWSAHFCSRFAGHAVKPVIASVVDSAGVTHRQQGEFNITATGVEGGLIYALSSPLREQLLTNGNATLLLDLAPGRTPEAIITLLAQARGSRSLSEHLRRRLNIIGVKAGLLREILGPQMNTDPQSLAGMIKQLPLQLVAARPIEEAISSAGGIRFASLDEHLMLRSLPGVFCAGEMLDWDAPTGGYLLSACFATGRAAGIGALHWLQGTIN